MIEVINLKKSFGNMEVLKGIDITINKGDIVAVLGPSGSGKSTFLRCLNCMEDPTSGKHHFQWCGYRGYERGYQCASPAYGNGVPAF